MRSSKYHDYRVFKFALFIILVILGLFIYIKCIRTPLEHTAGENAWTIVEKATCTEDGLRCKICTDCGKEFDYEVIPATGHVEGSEKIENRIASTCSVGGSYDKVIYCKLCKDELSRETVHLDLKPHTPGTPSKANIFDSTHTKEGTYTAVTRCTKCKTVISSEPMIIPAKGHAYDWELKYDEETGEFSMVGTCTCGEDGNVVVKTAEDGLTVTLDTSIATCCIKRYIGKITVDDIDIEKTVTTQPDPHRIYRHVALGEDNEVIVTYELITDYVKYDAELDKYYYSADLEGIVISGNAVWDDYGFSLGAYRCVLCEDKQCTECENGDYWFVVNIYSEKYDKRLAQ